MTDYLLDCADEGRPEPVASSRAAPSGESFAEPRAPSAVHGLDDGLFVACGLAWAAGLIHVVAAVEHIQEYALHAVFFALLAAAQFAWGAALYRWPTRRLLCAGAVVSILIVALWIVSRTTGLPIGPTPWNPEPVGALDSIATSDEILLALVAVLGLRARGTGPIERGSRYLAMGTGIFLILLSSLSLVGGQHAH